MVYWRLRLFGAKPGKHFVYFKTNEVYIPEMVVDLAVRRGDLLDVFAPAVDEVVRIRPEEYYTNMTE